MMALARTDPKVWEQALYHFDSYRDEKNSEHAGYRIYMCLRIIIFRLH